MAKTPHSPADPARGWRSYRREIQFLVLFVVLLGGGFALIAWQPVNDHVIVPFTAGVARTSAVVLRVIGQPIRIEGTRVYGEEFAVDIENGCNGVEALIIFLSATLSFPAPWPARLAGLAIGMVGIQIVNLIRVVALFLTGVHFPVFFDNSHTVVWQTIVILFAVLLWIFWAQRFAVASSGNAA
ncbi:MAG TPA: exosortase H [Thermoanaerobaculia bacterium]|nr:exosortase H [Thermoanaerobaculia bacterium]